MEEIMTAAIMMEATMMDIKNLFEKLITIKLAPYENALSYALAVFGFYCLPGMFKDFNETGRKQWQR